jgi:hypothetical protein
MLFILVLELASKTVKELVLKTIGQTGLYDLYLLATLLGAYGGLNL